MNELPVYRCVAGFVSPVCLVLLLLASLLVAQFSDSAVVQQRQVAILSQQLAAERVARELLQRAPDAAEFACQITGTARCWPGDEPLPAGTQFLWDCQSLEEVVWLCSAVVNGHTIGGPRAVLQAVLQESGL